MVGIVFVFVGPNYNLFIISVKKFGGYEQSFIYHQIFAFMGYIIIDK